MTERIMAPNHQNQDFYLQGLNDAREESKARIAALEKKLAALEWTAISPDNLPKPGADELFLIDHEGRLEVEGCLAGYSYAELIDMGYTHFRPISAPLAAPPGEDETK